MSFTSAGFATIYHAVMVSHSPLWRGVGGGVIVVMFGLFGLIGRRHRVEA